MFPSLRSWCRVEGAALARQGLRGDYDGALRCRLRPTSSVPLTKVTTFQSNRLHTTTTRRQPETSRSFATMTSPIKLAILDDYANTAPKHFSHISNLKIDSYPETLNPAKQDDFEALAKRLEPYQVISSMRERTPFSADLLKRLPNLKLLLSSGHRNAALDLPAFKERGIPVTATKGDRPSTTDPEADFEPPPPAGYSAVNQHAWALLLSLCGRIPQDDRALKTSSSTWQSGTGISLGGKTLGLLGLGKLGTAMAKVGVQSFSMETIAWSENLTQEKADAAAESAGLPQGTFRAVSKEELFAKSDVVSCHLVLSGRTKGIVGEKELGSMKRSAILLNTSRGPLIDEQALIEALTGERIGGFATDVFWTEPLPSDSPWRKADEWAKSATVLSPHMGYVNGGTMNRWYQEQAEDLQRWLQGQELPNRMA